MPKATALVGGRVETCGHMAPLTPATPPGDACPGASPPAPQAEPDLSPWLEPALASEAWVLPCPV